VSVSPYEYLPAGRGIPSILSRLQAMQEALNHNQKASPVLLRLYSLTRSDAVVSQNLSQYYVEIVHVDCVIASA